MGRNRQGRGYVITTSFNPSMSFRVVQIEEEVRLYRSRQFFQFSQQRQTFTASRFGSSSTTSS